MAKLSKVGDRRANKQGVYDADIQRHAELIALTHKADESPQQVGKLRAFLEANRDILIKNCLAYTIKDNLLKKVIPAAGSRELIQVEMENLRDDLESANPSTAEALLLDAVLLCWLRVQYAEAYRTSLMDGGTSLRQLEFAEKMLTQSYSRYVKSLTALARVQKVLAPRSQSSMDRSLKAVRLLKAMGAD